ncbi:hypothetical protein ILUMI_06707, partial [Ignelater luminosus]
MNFYLHYKLKMFVLFQLILIILYLSEYKTQKCMYDIEKFTEISCFNMTSFKQIKEEIETIVDQKNSLTDLIESLELTNCELLHLRINKFRFLSKLQQITIADSNITKLSPEKGIRNANEKD